MAKQIIAINEENSDFCRGDTLEEVIDKIKDECGHDESYIKAYYEFFELDTDTYFDVEFKVARVMKPVKKVK